MEKRIFIKQMTPAEAGDTGTHEKYIRLPNNFDYETFFQTKGWENGSVIQIDFVASYKLNGNDKVPLKFVYYANSNHEKRIPSLGTLFEKYNVTKDDVVYLESTTNDGHTVFTISFLKNSQIQLYNSPIFYVLKENKSLYAKKKLCSSIQQIFYGAPGTGKSFKIKRDTAGQSVIRTTFHPDSDYSTFVGCYKPTMDEDITYDKNGKETSHTKQIVYSFVAQAFLQAYVKAWQFYCEPEGGEIKPQFLIIEEINRGNCAQIFGDLFQLLDRNSEDGFSSYPIFADMDVKKYLEKVFEDFSFPDSLISHFPDYNGNIADDIKKGVVLVLPSNFYIWATMNTSDQSLFPIDSAFKRRWDWKYIPIDTAKEKWDIVVAGQKYSWTTFLDTINAEIFDVTKSEDKKMGFYFCRAKNHVIDAEKFVGKVIFYIYNDVFKDYGFDRQMFENENGAPIQFHEYYKNDGSVNEEMVTKFLTNLKLNQQAEGKEENE